VEVEVEVGVKEEVKVEVKVVESQVGQGLDLSVMSVTT
jgi:hypothetical protein